MATCSPPPAEGEIRVGVSTCLLGENVRYDGGHKRDRYITDTLAAYFTFVPVCPEVETGMGVPREAVRLVGDPEHPRLVGNRTGTDWTDRMLAWAGPRLEALARERLCGFIFKSGSPSSGMERVKVYSAGGMPSRSGPGLFAGALRRRFPDLPVTEEGRLHDARLREHFIERVFACHRLQSLAARPFARSAWVAFHSAHKYQLLAHSPARHRTLGRLVAGIKGLAPRAFVEEYRREFLEALQAQATPSKHANVLQHILGYLKTHLDSEDRRDLLETIGRYRRGLVPLIVPLTLLNHYLRKFRVEYLCGQTYLNPHPAELMLRNQ